MSLDPYTQAWEEGYAARGAEIELEKQVTALRTALLAVLPYAETRWEDLDAALMRGEEDPGYPGADACAKAVLTAAALVDYESHVCIAAEPATADQIQVARDIYDMGGDGAQVVVDHDAQVLGDAEDEGVVWVSAWVRIPWREGDGK